MLSLFTITALGFAAARATQLVVHDTIADPIRERLEIWHAKKIDSQVRTFVRSLISCTYCAGWWLSIVTALTYVTAIGGWHADAGSLFVHAIECWAVAGVQALLNRVDDTFPVR